MAKAMTAHIVKVLERELTSQKNGFDKQCVI